MFSEPRLRPLHGSVITRATAHPTTSAVENTASRRTNGFKRQLLARNPVALPYGRRAWFCIDLSWNEHARPWRARDFRSITRSLDGRSPPPVAFKVRHWGQRGSTFSHSHLIIL